MFPAFDEHLPATMSHKIIHGLLRERFGYNGIIVSDDMEMKAVRGRWPLGQQLDYSCKAGVDLFLFCKEYELQEEAFETLVHLQENDSKHDQLAIESEKRLLALQKEIQAPHPPVSIDMVGSPSYKKLCDLILNRGQS
jgi:beta-N-acetylhexosaminidase